MRCCEMFFGCSQSPDQMRQRQATGNQAFEEYRSDTLRRLEEEERDFHDFLDRLRAAKDKEQFDEFLAQRRANPNPM